MIRTVRVLAAAARAPRMEALGESVLRMRVWPGDLDYNLHMNNGRFLTLMDLGRLDLVVRMGAVEPVRRNRWKAVVASLAVRYRRSLQPFQAFELRTRTVGWDERWIFLEQRFTRGGETMALAVVKALFLGPGGRVPPAEFVAATGHDPVSPPIPDEVRAWEAAEHAIQGRAGE